jgi:Tol biopolymer transport system component
VASNKPRPVAAERHLVYEKVLGEKGIWIADVDGGHARLLVSDGEAPVISPDGRLVAYSGLSFCSEPELPGCDLYVVSTSGGEKPRLLAKGFGGTMLWWSGGGIMWSPDSKRIITSRSSSEDLVSIDVTSGKELELAKGSFLGWSLSPDGKQIVFARHENPDADWLSGTGVDLFVVGLNGGEAKRITDTGDATKPVWGPKSIAFSKVISCYPKQGIQARSGCRNYAWGRNEIWQVQPDGTGGKNITGSYATRFQGQGCAGLIPVDWSEDGRALLGAWLCEHTLFSVAVDPETGATDEFGGGSDAVALSRDGRFALVHADTGPETPPDDERVLIVPYGGANGKLVARGAVDPSWNR